MDNQPTVSDEKEERKKKTGTIKINQDEQNINTVHTRSVKMEDKKK